MHVQTHTLSPRLLPPPAILLHHLLLPQTGSVPRPADAGNLAPDLLAMRATKITMVLSEILDERCYFHGALNDD